MYCILFQSIFKAHLYFGKSKLYGRQLVEALDYAGHRLSRETLTDLIETYGSRKGKLDFQSFLCCVISVQVKLEVKKALEQS